MQNKLCLQFDTIPYIIYFTVKWFPQKKKLSNNFVQLSFYHLYLFPTNVCFEKCDKKIGHCVCLRDMMGQIYPVYACNGTNHARHVIG